MINMSSTNQKLLYVASHSDPGTLGGFIAHTLRERREAGDSLDVTLQGIGAAAVNQAVKAIAIASSHMQKEGLRLAQFNSFQEVIVNDHERTAMRMRVEAVKEA